MVGFRRMDPCCRYLLEEQGILRIVDILQFFDNFKNISTNKKGSPDNALVNVDTLSGAVLVDYERISDYGDAAVNKPNRRVFF